MEGGDKGGVLLPSFCFRHGRRVATNMGHFVDPRKRNPRFLVLHNGKMDSTRDHRSLLDQSPGHGDL
jgi:hypothetical protein